MNLFRLFEGSIGIGEFGTGLPQFRAGRFEESAFAQDTLASEPTVAMMEDAWPQGPVFEIGCDRIPRAVRGGGIVNSPVTVERTLAAPQHRAQVLAQRCFHLRPERPRLSVEIGLNHKNRIIVRALEDRHRHEMQRGHLVLQAAVHLCRGQDRVLFVVFDFFDDRGKPAGARRLDLEHDRQRCLPHALPPPIGVQF